MEDETEIIATPEEKPEEKPVEQPKKDDAEKTVDELKAEAEEAEKQYKERRDGASEEEIRANMIRRREKAQEKLKALESEPIKQSKNDDVDVRDIVTLAKFDISEDSDKAKILAKYKTGGLIKSFKEGLEHAGVKAEFEALDAKNKAKSVIDENDTDEVKQRTTKEVIASYRNTGEVPNDAKLQKAIASDNLKSMGL